MQHLDIYTILQIATVLIILISLRWRLPSKDDVKRLDGRIDALDADMNTGFIQQDAKIEARLVQQDAKIEARLVQQDAKIEARLVQQDAKIEARFEKQDAKFDERFEKQDAKIEERFDKQDAKIDRLRLELKEDMQRLEDRLQAANEYHARSVDLLDAIRRELQDRREPL